VRVVSLVRGVATVEALARTTTRYTITTGAGTPARMFIRHPRKGGYTPVSMPPGTEPTADGYLVPVPLTARRESVLVIEETLPQRRDVKVLGADGSSLLAYLAGTALPAAADAGLRKALEQRRQLTTIEGEVALMRERHEDLANRIAELRESLRTIQKSRGAAALRQKLLDRLAVASRESDDASSKLADRTSAQADLRAQLEDALRDLEIKPVP
jgi:hypothetical protein